ncbi:MAG: hypothetical protein ACFB20_03900 [Opitutales bacterium]
MQWQLLQRPMVARRVGQRAYAAAIVSTLVLNLGLLWIAFVLFADFVEETDGDLFQSTAGASLQLGLKLNPPPKKQPEPEPESEVPVPVPVLPEYVEANPDANNDFAPEETNQESFQNQVAAQEDPDFLAEGEAPTVEDGEVDVSPKIVSGSLDEPAPSVPQGEPVPPQPDAQPEAQPTTTPPPTPPPAPAFLQQEAVTQEGLGSTPFEPNEAEEPVEDPSETTVELFLPEVPPVEQPSDQPAEPTQPSEVAQQPSESTPQTGLPEPRPRPRLDAVRVPAGLTRVSNSVAARAGTLAINSRLSKFGLYSQRFNEAIYRRWLFNLEGYPFTPADSGSRVVIVGELDREGYVHDIVVKESTGTRQFELICENAIIDNQPYGPWTEDMTRVFGERETFSITFLIR